MKRFQNLNLWLHRGPLDQRPISSPFPTLENRHRCKLQRILLSFAVQKLLHEGLSSKLLKPYNSLRNIKMYVSLFEPNWRQLPGSQISTNWENAPENSSFAPYFVHQNQRRRCTEGHIKSIGGRSGRREKAKQGNLWDWRKSEVKREILLSPRQVQDSHQLTSTARTMGWGRTRDHGGSVVCPGWGSHPEGSGKKGVTLTAKGMLS